MAEFRLNERLTSQPIVILTGAGASKWLGKATTFDVYESEEFLERAGSRPFSLLTDLRQILLDKDPADPVDLEYLLDYVLKIANDFDFLSEVPELGPVLKNNYQNIKDGYLNAYQLALDFLVDYYGNIDAERASALYQPFFDNIAQILNFKRSRGIITVFTLNYDEAIESAIDNMPRYRRVDGFNDAHTPTWSPERFSNFSPGPAGRVTVALFKLHGSVSWTQPSGSKRIEKTVGVPRRRRGRDHVILYPTRLRKKEFREQPYATAFDYLEKALNRGKLAVCIGTSFRDAEIADALRKRCEKARPFSILAASPKPNVREIASRIGVSQKYVTPVRVSFEPDGIEKLSQSIAAKLSGQ